MKDDLDPKMVRLYEALRDGTTENLDLRTGKLAGRTAHFVVAEGEDEDDDVPVALLLDKKMRAALAEAFSDEDDEEDEESDERPAGRRFVP